MDERVTALWERLTSYRNAEAIPVVDLRREVLALHDAVEDEESRIALMKMFNMICDVTANYLRRSGGDLTAFEAHRRGQIWMFLRAECLVDGELDRDRLRRVTDREVAAKRMAPDDKLRRYALGDDRAFDDEMATLH